MGGWGDPLPRARAGVWWRAVADPGKGAQTGALHGGSGQTEGRRCERFDALEAKAETDPYRPGDASTLQHRRDSNLEGPDVARPKGEERDGVRCDHDEAGRGDR